MASFEINLASELVRQLQLLEDYDNIAQKMLNAASPILENKVKNEASKHIETGDMHKSIKTKKPTKNKYGWYTVTSATGKDEKGDSNAEKMLHLEYGYEDKSGKHVAPKPVMTKAINEAKDEVIEELQKQYNKAVSG